MSCQSKAPVALSTGQAARFCLVTADTIVNWIKYQHLPARRTAGGQFRILIRDLRSYMAERGMQTDLLDAEFETRRYCWEYGSCAEAGPLMGVDCEDCLVYRSRTLNCFELRSALTSQPEQLEACARCEYLQNWRCDYADTPKCSSSRGTWGRDTRRMRNDHVE
jgi:excisionase family DNA binding protein